jgi:hypothetical protein
MKRFTFITAFLSASLLAVWMIFQAFAASPAKNDNVPGKVHDANSELLQVVQSGEKAGIPMTGADARKVAPVFDTTGVVLSDPTGMILGGVHPADVKIAPVFDMTGALVSDPTGTIWSVVSSPAIPVTGSDMKVAPVFDATGAVVSDPTGTLLNVNPK